MPSGVRSQKNFIYTQQSLSTFDNCPLKFKKRYLEHLKWDSLPNENVNEGLQLGNDFHLMAQRFFLGVNNRLDEIELEFPVLAMWMKSLEENFKIDLKNTYLPEFRLRMSLGNLRLEANYDLLIIKEDSIEIWDWKTHNNKGLKQDEKGRKLTDSLQTLVYLYVLKEQVALVVGREVECERINMSYWQPAPSCKLAEIQYNSRLHENYKIILENKIMGIENYDYSKFDQTKFKKHCKFCEFNWLCNNIKPNFDMLVEDTY